MEYRRGEWREGWAANLWIFDVKIAKFTQVDPQGALGVAKTAANYKKKLKRQKKKYWRVALENL